MMTGKSPFLVAIALGAVFDSVAFSRVIPPSSPYAPLVDVRVVTDEPDAALAILARKKAGQPIIDEDWQRLFSSEGYIRLKKREAAMQRAFEDSEFKVFILSDKLAERAEALQHTLDKWKRADSTLAARRALAYLPRGARIRAKIYPMIKPRENSFVFEVNSDPAIFMYLDPDVTRDQFENTLAHELHHIGYGSSCPSKQAHDDIAKLPEKARTVINWIGAFGEGFAMLAAAGGPDVHPHLASKAEDRARWDRDLANFNDDLKKVEGFFNRVLDGALSSKEEEEKEGFSFFGIQGPWYTVGWKMAVTIEKTYGRARLIECLCDPRELLPAFNRAVAQSKDTQTRSLSTWSPTVVRAISVKPAAK